MIPSSLMDKMTWKTRRVKEFFGNQKLELEVLEDLEKTIDDLFLVLEKSGKPELLETWCPYFGQIWPSSRALTQYLADHPVEKNGAVRVLEVGCGLAMPSLFLAKTVKYSKIFASDFHPEVQRFLEVNLKLNDLKSNQLAYASIDWKTARPETLGLDRFHVVMGSDILYEKQHPEQVAEALHHWVKPQGRIIVSDPARPYLQIFVDEMKARGWLTNPQIMKVSDGQGGVKETYLLDFIKI